MPGLRFAQNGLQPEMITRLTEGVIALVNGTVTGQGRIAWNGTGEVTSTGEFSTTDTDLAAAFGPVTGLSGTIRFTDLLGLETAPGQTINVATINPGILVENGVITYQLLPGQLVRIQAGRWPFMGGELILRETVLNLGRPSPKRLTFEVRGLDANMFVSSFGFNDIKAEGRFDGVLPMIFDDNGGRIVGGRLDSRGPGGRLSYDGAVNKANLGTAGNLAFNALRDLRFRSMIIRLDGDLAGEFGTTLVIDGVGLCRHQRHAAPDQPLRRHAPAQVQRLDPRTFPRADRHRQVAARSAHADRHHPRPPARQHPRHRHRSAPARGRLHPDPDPRRRTR